MSIMVDDLLEEVEHLGGATRKLDDVIEQVNDKQAQLKKAESSTPSSIEGNALVLEAAKIAQDAAKHSHQATDSVIKIAEQQKAQVLELHESNFSWRQAVRNATNEIKSAKNGFVIMMMTAIIVSLIALSVMGYLLYTLNQKNAQFKGEVLDIIQTENMLLTKQITLKVDELSSMVEVLTAEVKKSTPDTSDKHVSAPTSKPTAMDNHDAAQTHPAPTIQKGAESIHKTPVDTHHVVPVTTHHPEPSESTNKHPQPTAEHSDNTKAIAPAKTTISDHAEYSEIKKLVEKILNAQQKLQSHAPATPVSKTVDPVQLQKLNDLNAAMQKQARTLAEIRERLARQAQPISTPIKNKVENSANSQKIENALFDLKAQLESLSMQQSAIELQVDALRKEFKVFNQTPQAPKPYSYRAQ